MSTTKLVIISILVPPVGLLFIWTKTNWDTGKKILFTALVGGYTFLWISFLGGFLGGFSRSLSK